MISTFLRWLKVVKGVTPKFATVDKFAVHVVLRGEEVRLWLAAQPAVSEESVDSYSKLCKP